METTMKDEKLGGKTHEKFLHKLNKQQIERWRHLGNISQLFLVQKYIFPIKF